MTHAVTVLSEQGEAAAEAERSAEEQLAALPDDFLECLAFGHTWRVETGYGYTDQQGHWQVNFGWATWTCPRCGMAKESFYDAHLALLESRYTRPEARQGVPYGVKGAGRGSHRQAARREFWRRHAAAAGTAPARLRQ